MNPYHDAKGRFTSKGGGKSGGRAGKLSKAKGSAAAGSPEAEANKAAHAAAALERAKRARFTNELKARHLAKARERYARYSKGN